MLFVILHARGQRPAPTRGDSMDKLVIEGGVPLTGGIDISGSKNAALPILFASILLSEPAVIANVPDLRDIHTTLKLLNVLGCACGYDDHEVRTQPGQLLPEAPYDLVRTMRASVLCLGPLLARIGQAAVDLRTGEHITTVLAEVDDHIKGLFALFHCNNILSVRGWLAVSCVVLRQLSQLPYIFMLPCFARSVNALRLQIWGPGAAGRYLWYFMPALMVQAR